jgi:hypothetical protein
MQNVYELTIEIASQPIIKDITHLTQISAEHELDENLYFYCILIRHVTKINKGIGKTIAVSHVSFE